MAMIRDAEGLRKRVRVRLTEQRALVRSLLRQRELLQGSVFARYGECGKEGCACRQGRKHGPYYVFSMRSGGKGSFAYLDGARLDEARTLVGRYREFRRGLRRLKKLNLELVDLLRRYQETMTRKGGRRLKVEVARTQKTAL
jgi:hypothetical protein